MSEVKVKADIADHFHFDRRRCVGVSSFVAVSGKVQDQGSRREFETCRGVELLEAIYRSSLKPRVDGQLSQLTVGDFQWRLYRQPGRPRVRDR